MEQTLIRESKHNGRYVAIKDFKDDTVISDAKTLQEGYEKAIKKGFMVQIY